MQSPFTALTHTAQRLKTYGSYLSSLHLPHLTDKNLMKSTNMAAEENGALRQRFELLKGAEHHKNALIEVRPKSQDLKESLC